MGNSVLSYSFQVTPVFHYIKDRVEEVGLYVHEENAKETIQVFLNEYSFNERKKYIGAIQYEGSNHYQKREPHIVSFRFKRSNISSEIKQELEAVTSFRRDKNAGPNVNPEAESIAFKFEGLNDEVKETIESILTVLQKYV